MDRSEPLSLDAIELRLRRELATVQSELECLAAGDGSHPGDGADQAFAEHVTQMESTIGELHRALERLSQVRPVDLTAIASQALSDLLLDLEKPLVLSVDWDASLPNAMTSDDALRSVVARMMNLVARFVDAGDEVSLRTLRDDDSAVLRIQVTPHEPWRRHGRAVDFELRCRSLTEFVTDLGGEFRLTADDGVLLELRLRIAVNTP